MDEEALLKQFAAQFAHGPDDADDTDAAAAAQGADSTANQVADDADQSPATFDTQQFLNGLDAIFDRHTAATEAGPYLEQAMVDAEMPLALAPHPDAATYPPERRTACSVPLNYPSWAPPDRPPTC